jgi:serine/threonine protein kinase
MFGNRYQLGKEIGAGGMGTVYLGTDTLSRQTVAIKHLKNDLVQPQLIERFKREGEALRELNHPNIVKLLDTLEQDGAYYLVMEYVSGGDLSDLLKNGQLPIERCLKLALDLADALTRAHKLDIIHRDLKPANVLIAKDGTLRLTDFGVAHIGTKQRVTDTDAIVGTVDYLAPESLDGGEIDPRADIWAFGVMLFEMLIGERPFTGNTIAQTLMAILTQPTPDLEALRPDATIALVDLVYRMLEKDRNSRIRSVRQVGLELEDILHGRTTHTPPQTRFAPDTPDYFLRPKHNLPTQTTSFVGREAELAELAKLLNDSKIRLVTILAPGGMGKTRLALEAAEKQIPHFESGVYFVELAPLSDPAHIVSAIAEATSYQFQGDGREQKQQILDFLGNKNMLLVLDNYEHLLEGAALVTEILKAAPHVKILATSRQRLNQLSETLFNLQGMDFPAWETPADALEYAAVQLFMQSARRAKPDFEVTADNMDAIARICKLVQGMPLGIVMAAAWLALLSPDEIAVEIANSIDFLSSDMGEIPERQRSIRAVFDYSWDLMNEAEQQVFMKLAVFRGGFTRQAAQAITGATLQQLMSLVNKSLIRRDNDSGRYEIHELLRQYAAEKAEQVGQTKTIAEAHMTYYAYAMHERESHLKGHRQLEALTDIAADFENVRGAWIWAVEHEHYKAVDQMQNSLERYCYLRTRFQEGLALFDMAVQRWSSVQEAGYKAIHGRLLTNLGFTYYHLQETKQGIQILERGLEIAREQGERRDIALAIYRLGMAASVSGQPQQAWTLAQESRALFRETGDKTGEAWVLHLLGYLAGHRVEMEQAEQLWLEALSLYRDVGDKEGISSILMNLGFTEVTFHWRFDRAEAYYRKSLVLGRELHLPARTSFTLINLALLLTTVARLDEAENVAREAILVAQEANHRPDIIGSLLTLAQIKALQTDYDTALKLNAEAQSLVRTGDDRVLVGMVKVNRCFVLCAKGDYAAAEKALSAGFHDMAYGAQLLWLLVPVLCCSLVLAFHRRQAERALALASLLAHHPLVSFWDTDPLAKRLIAHLQQTLPADVYVAAWEQGKSLDLDTVIQELLAELGEMN